MLTLFSSLHLSLSPPTLSISLSPLSLALPLLISLPPFFPSLPSLPVSLLSTPPPPLLPLLPLLSQCIIYLLVQSPRLPTLLTNQGIIDSLARLHSTSYVDQDILFDETRNCDYSHSQGAVSRERFVSCYHAFIKECVSQRGLDVSSCHTHTHTHTHTQHTVHDTVVTYYCLERVQGMGGEIR